MKAFSTLLIFSLWLPRRHHHKLDGPALEPAGHERHDEGALEGGGRCECAHCCFVLVMMMRCCGWCQLSVNHRPPRLSLFPSSSSPIP